MVVSSEEYKRRRDDLETRISKMISEGGLGAAYYYNDTQGVHEVDIDKDNQLMN